MRKHGSVETSGSGWKARTSRRSSARSVPRCPPGEEDRVRRQLGAYYTDPDAAQYLCVSTLLPWLTDGERLGELTAAEAVTANLDLRRLVLHWLAAGADEEQVARVWRRLHRVRVLDPTCGAGVFLVAALHVLEQAWETVLARLLRLGAPEEAVALGLLTPLLRRRAVRQRIIERNLFGVDVDPTAVAACRARLERECSGGRPSANLLVGNAVTGADWDSAFSQTDGSSRFDVILGNPPYVHAGKVEYRPTGFHTGPCRNVYAWVVERSLRLLATDGRLGMVLPVSATSGPDYRPLAELYLRHHCWISTFSNRPAKLFEGVEQRLALLITAPAARGEPTLWTTAYQHWYEEERPGLFERLRYTRGVLHEGFPAKLGVPEAVSAFSKLTGTPLVSWSASGEGEVWLHNAPTYWVRALPFRPNAGIGESSHYRCIRTRKRAEADALTAVLSSSTFYFWFKAVSNCRDLGRREWESFPMGKISDKRRTRLAELGQALEQRLRSTARERARRYPSGTVRYEEYYPAHAVDILDQVDGLLARHFGLTGAEADYVRQLDRKYRMGRMNDGRE